MLLVEKMNKCSFIKLFHKYSINNLAQQSRTSFSHCSHRRVYLNTRNQNTIPNRLIYPVNNFSTCVTTGAKELLFTTPTGHVAGKVWNEDAPTAVLCLHGWQDNAGSFDLLAPLLPKHLCLVAIDLLGHGRSSYKPFGFARSIYDHILTVDRVVRQCKWKQVILLNHSFGGVIGGLYPCFRPSMVHSTILIDVVGFKEPKPHEEVVQQLEQDIGDYFELENKLMTGSRPTYTYEALLERALQSPLAQNNLTEKGEKVLLIRGSKQMPDGTYAFTCDPQERLPSLPSIGPDVFIGYVQNFQSRLLLLEAENGVGKTDTDDELYKVMRSKSSESSYHVLPGTHHLHLETPELVAPFISEFLSKEKVSDVVNNIDEDGKPAIRKFIVPST